MSKNKDCSLWDDVRTWLTDATRSAMREAEDLSRRGRLKLEIIRTSHEIERQLSKLGGTLYSQASADPDAPVVLTSEQRKLIQEIARLEAELAARKRAYAAEKKKRT
ncbi:MAG: hypothetical protein ABIK37_01740 [candidate division WOR-3 bacterium]